MVPRKLLNEPQPCYRVQHQRQQDDMFVSVTVVFHRLLWLDSCWANCPMIGGRTEGGYRNRTLHITAKDVGEMWLKSVNSLLFFWIVGIVLRFLMNKNETVGVLNQDVLNLVHCPFADFIFHFHIQLSSIISEQWQCVSLDILRKVSYFWDSVKLSMCTLKCLCSADREDSSVFPEFAAALCRPGLLINTAAMMSYGSLKMPAFLSSAIQMRWLLKCLQQDWTL